MYANPSTKLEFLGTISKFRKRNKIFVVACLRTPLGTGHYLSPGGGEGGGGGGGAGGGGGGGGRRIFVATTENLHDPHLKHAEWV